MDKNKSGWKKGPMPPDTWGWGGVVPVGLGGSGFFFADFQGDHVEVIGDEQSHQLKAHEVVWYNNSLGLPPTATSRTGGG